jgi:hypothetical protein
MPANVRVIRSNEFLRETTEGFADMAWAEQVIAEFVARSEPLQGDYSILVDTRRAIGLLSATQLWYLSEKLARHQSTFSHRTAILCPAERFDHARFFALCAEGKGCNVRAFTRYEDAMEWCLAEDGARGAA